MKPFYAADGIELWLGDCRDVLVWRSADVMICDPPYGMRFVSAWPDTKRPIAGDESTAIRDAAIALWGDSKPAAVFGTWKVPRPEKTRHRLIWDKSDGTGPGMGDLDSAFGNSDEEIYLLGQWPTQERRQSNVLRTRVSIANLATALGHPTPKPVDLMQRLLRAAPAGRIADPFAGSGSTLLAAKNLGRLAIGVELREDYCELIAERLSQTVLPLEAV